ncbi:K(+)-transporting ATPase subunit F, partial [Dysosmobacter welbionis]
SPPPYTRSTHRMGDHDPPPLSPPHIT